MKGQKFIICGVPRAGKSTLASRLASVLQCSHIPLDPLITSFHRHYPQSGIHLSMQCDIDQYTDICKKMTQFLVTYINALDKELDNYIIEGFHMDIDMLVEHFTHTHTIVIMGYPSISRESKIRLIRQYDTSNIHWTHILEHTALVKQVQWFIELSHIFYRKAKEYGLRFIDTSTDYETVINEYRDINATHLITR